MSYRTIKEPALSGSFSIDEVEVFARSLGAPSAAPAPQNVAHARFTAFSSQRRRAKKAHKSVYGRFSSFLSQRRRAKKAAGKASAKRRKR